MLSIGKHLFTGIAVGSMLVYDRKVRELEVAHALQYPPTKDRIRGEYENRVRRNAPPEKIFEIFASVKKDNEIYMSHSDLFKAITPYNYAVNEKAEESEDGKDDEKDKQKDDKKEDDVNQP